jgi:aldehyde:ferredoxin oxidoreductase
MLVIINNVAEYMAATGFDAIMVYGSADRPVWLEISEDSEGM